MVGHRAFCYEGKYFGIGDLVNKESNRIKEMQKVLKQVGINSKSTKDELKIFGKGISAKEENSII